MPRVLASAVRARDPESLDRRHLIQEAELLAVRVDPCPELPAMALDEREAVATQTASGEARAGCGD